MITQKLKINKSKKANLVMRKGVSTIVAGVLVTLITIVAIGVFYSIFSKTLAKNTTDESGLCLGVDLFVNNCFTINQYTDVNGFITQYPGVYTILERGVGGSNKAVKGIRYILKDTSGVDHVESPINVTAPGVGLSDDFSGWVEYTSGQASTYTLGYTASSVSIAAVVGTKSSTVCKPSRDPVPCVPYPLFQCADGIDNDGDNTSGGGIDVHVNPYTGSQPDPQCSGPTDNDESA